MCQPITNLLKSMACAHAGFRWSSCTGAAILLLVYWTGATQAVAATTLRQEKAEFFRLFDFNNPSLLNNNPSLSVVKTQLVAAAAQTDSAALITYTSAMSNLWKSAPASGYSCGLSRVLQSSTAFASNFFSWIDLDHPGLELAKSNVLAANYPAALNAWRDYTVNKWRLMEFPPLYQQSYKGNPIQQNIAQLLVGEWTYAQYMSYANTTGWCDFLENYGMSGSPGTIGPISWTNQPPTSDTTKDGLYSYSSFFFSTPLDYRYWYGELLGSGTNVMLRSTGTLVTATFAKPHGLTSGNCIYVTRASPAPYSGLFVVSVVNSTSVTYNALSPPGVYNIWSNLEVLHSRQPKVLQKWFEILGDFSTRQKNMVSALQFVENAANRTNYHTLYNNCDWSTSPGTTLSQAWRLRELLVAAAIFCKLLPEITPVQRNWDTEIQLPVTTPLAPGSTSLVPAEALARLTLSLMADTTEGLLLRYRNTSAAPAQRFIGLNALCLTAYYLDEFKAAPELRRQTNDALADHALTIFYPDGPMLERSPNYNDGNADDIRYLGALMGTNTTPGVNLLTEKLVCYDRARAFMQNPLGGLPRMASYAWPNPPALWLGGTVLTNWGTSFRLSATKIVEPTAAGIYAGLLDSGRPLPPVTSVAFPCAGYYMMRNGWDSRARWLYFASTPPGNGHRQMDHNGIQMAAFGRHMLTVSGPPPYGATFLDSSQIADYNGFSNYQGEGSSFKTCTVAVDGRSQNEDNGPNMTVTSNTVPGVWFTSPAFDCVEGSYSAGYGGVNVYNPFTNSTAIVNSVTHQRSIVFLRDPGLWIVTDLMTASDTATHNYRQMWKFPGYSVSNWLSCGFETNQVVTTSTTRIDTVDPDGPNVHLYHLGPKTVGYETYTGSRAPYLGWFSDGIGGLRLPAADVHAVWNGSGTQLLVTVIAPSDTGHASPVTAIRTNATSATSINIELTLDNGHTVKLVQGLSTQTLAVGSSNITARTIVIDVAPGGVQHGVALAAAGDVNPGFSFSASPTSYTVKAKISIPARFRWKAEGSWTVPESIAEGPPVWISPITGMWSNPSNWSQFAVPHAGDDVTFGTAGTTAIVDIASESVNSIMFNRTTGFTLSATNGGALTITNRITVTGTNTYNIFTPIAMPAACMWSVTNGATLQVGGAIGGAGSLTKDGAGILILAGANTYPSTTTVSSGTLLVNGSISTGSVSVVSGSTLGGTGIIDGRVTVNAGGIISPGPTTGTGALRFGQSLNCTNNSVVRLRLGTNCDRVAVTGNLYLGGVLNIVDSSGFTTNNYTIFTCTGAPGTNGLTLGAMPGKPEYVYGIDTNTAGQVRLRVSLSPFAQWQNQYFDSYSNVLAQAGIDADGDRMSNYQEFLAGTDPRQSASVLRIGSLAAQINGELSLGWQCVSGKSYQIAYADSLLNPWLTNLANSFITSTGQPFLIYVDRTSPLPKTRFYKIRLLP